MASSDEEEDFGCGALIGGLIVIGIVGYFVMAFWPILIGLLILAGVIAAAYFIHKQMKEDERKELEKAERQRQLAEKEMNQQVMRDFETEVLSEL